jgi:hypothetical protein
VDALGKQVRFCDRKRLITPFRLALCLSTSFTCDRVETPADLHREFNALFETQVSYKAFYNQLAKEQFAEFMVSMTSLVLTEMAFKVLGFKQGGPFSEFNRI